MFGAGNEIITRAAKIHTFTLERVALLSCLEIFIYVDLTFSLRPEYS